MVRSTPNHLSTPPASLHKLSVNITGFSKTQLCAWKNCLSYVYKYLSILNLHDNHNIYCLYNPVWVHAMAHFNLIVSDGDNSLRASLSLQCNLFWTYLEIMHSHYTRSQSYDCTVCKSSQMYICNSFSLYMLSHVFFLNVSPLCFTCILLPHPVHIVSLQKSFNQRRRCQDFFLMRGVSGHQSQSIHNMRICKWQKWRKISSWHILCFKFLNIFKVKVLVGSNLNRWGIRIQRVLPSHLCNFCLRSWAN